MRAWSADVGSLHIAYRISHRYRASLSPLRILPIIAFRISQSSNYRISRIAYFQVSHFAYRILHTSVSNCCRCMIRIPGVRAKRIVRQFLRYCCGRRSRKPDRITTVTARHRTAPMRWQLPDTAKDNFQHLHHLRGAVMVQARRPRQEHMEVHHRSDTRATARKNGRHAQPSFTNH